MDDISFEEISDDEEDEKRDRDRYQWIHMVEVIEPIGGKGPNHNELTMDDVDDSEDPKDEAKSH